MEFTSIDGVSVRPDGAALSTSPFTPPGSKGSAKSDSGKAQVLPGLVLVHRSGHTAQVSSACLCMFFFLSRVS